MKSPAVPKYGFMNTSAGQLCQQSRYLSRKAAFIEIQIHDDMKASSIHSFLHTVSDDYDGFITIHGEGETDGIRKILFCSEDNNKRQRYVSESVALYSSVIANLMPHRVERIVVHPDTIDRKSPRSQQIGRLAESLKELSTGLNGVEVCIEPRGGDRQGKVLRAEIEDLQTLANGIGSSGVGLCIDVAQLFIVHGNSGSEQFLEELKHVRLPVKEFHVSDVSQGKRVTNRVATEVGKGSVNWRTIIPLMQNHCDDFLIETLGGIKVFERSRAYIDALVMKDEILL